MNSPPIENVQKISSIAKGPEHIVPIQIEEKSKETREKIKYNPNINTSFFTIHVKNHDKIVANAEIYGGSHKRGLLKSLCRTNSRGRCSIRLPNTKNSTFTFVVKKNGFITKTTRTRVKDKGYIQIPLIPGRSLDIFTLNRSFGYTKGLKGNSIYIDGIKIGQTDNFGHFTYSPQGADEDLLNITIKSKDNIPEVISSDIVAMPQITMTQYFGTKVPILPRLATLPVKMAGTISNKIQRNLDRIQRDFRSSLNKTFFTNTHFQNHPIESLVNELQRSTTSISKIAHSGWQDHYLKGKFDALIQPTIINHGHAYLLEISLIDFTGQVIAAAKVELEETNNSFKFDNILPRIKKKLVEVFPFEGSIISHSKGEVKINLAKENFPLKLDDLIEIFGKQISDTGDKHSLSLIAIAKIKALNHHFSKATINWQRPRSVLSRGDQVVLRPITGQSPSFKKNAPYVLTVIDKDHKGIGKLPLKQVNAYLNNKWIASSDAFGKIYFNVPNLNRKKEKLNLIKYGYKAVQKSFDFSVNQDIEIPMEQLHSFIQIATNPPGGAVSIDGLHIGTSPLSSPIAVKSGFVKLEIKAPPGYLDIMQILELEEGTLDLTGSTKIHFEIDYLGKVSRLTAQNQFEKSINILESIPEKHSDYFHGLHLLGELYLSHLSNPLKAYDIYKKLLNQKKIINYQDKRFIGSYINLGIASTQLGESYFRDTQSKSRQLYSEAIDIFNETQNYLHYIPKYQFDLADFQLEYFRSLAKLKLANLDNDSDGRKVAFHQWQNLLKKYHSKFKHEQIGRAHV